MDNLILLASIGLIAGVMSGMFGIGGGAIIVPALMLGLNFSQIQANGTSLAALLLPVGIFACISYYRAGKLRLIPATAVGLGLAIGAWFGAGIALDLDPTLLRQSYGIFLLYMSWRYISPLRWLAELRGADPEIVSDNTDADLLSPLMLAGCVGIGLIAGVASGLFGIGGGVVIVPALMLLLSFDQKLATGTSLGALLMPVALPGVLRYYEAGQLDLNAAAPIALALIAGSIVGARVALGLPTKTVRRLYGLFLLFIGLRFLLNL